MATVVISRSDSEPLPKTQSEQTRDFLAEAMERFHLAETAEAQIRTDALDDFRFLTGDQWNKNVEKQRTDDGRPCLTMNRLRQFRRMITNEQRQQRPAIQVNPVGDDADTETAEILQGLCRHVEVNSDAEIAYDTGFEHMATGGFGYWMVTTEYVDDESDEQEIFIRRIKDPFMVYVDPRAVKPDYSDALFYFIVEDMPREIYRMSYPDSALASADDLSSIGDATPDWLNDETVRVAEYFYVEIEKVKHKGGSGRQGVKRKVKWAMINAVEVLEEGDIPCKWIPIVPVLGDDQLVDGKRNLVGMIRDAKDPQRMYNFQISAAAEMIALAPKAPFIVAEGQLENHEGEWAQANQRTFATLTYKPVSSTNGSPQPPPQRNATEPPIQAMAMMIRQADNDLKATTGIYDASLGQQGPEQSGKAVLLRQKQSDVANLNFTDNLARSIRFTGRILIDMFPRVYTAATVKRIIKPDETVMQVGIYNSQTSEAPEPDDDDMQAVSKIYDIGTGRYDVSITVGPTYQSKRQEAVASQVALISAYPNIMPIAGDLLIRNMDWPGASEIADRMKKMLPPALQDQPQGQDPTQMAQQAQAQAAQMQAHNEQLMQMVQHLNQVISQKMIEADNKTKIALIDQETKLNVARITASKDRDTAGADREMQMLQMMHDSAHEVAGQQMDQAHQAALAHSDNAHDLASQQMQQQVLPPPPGGPGPAPVAQGGLPSSPPMPGGGPPGLGG